MSGRRVQLRFDVRIVLPALALAACALLVATTARAETIAITGAKVYPVSGAAIENATVVLRDGKIAAVGAAVAVPAGARVIDGRGKWVTPGLFDSSSRLGAVEIDAYDDTTEAQVEDDRITAAFDVVDGLNPLATNVPVTRVEGITRAVVMPRAGKSLIAGQAALIDLAALPAPDPRGMVERDPVAMVAVLGSQGAELSGGARGAAMLRLREALEDAKDFAQNRKAWETAQHREYPLSRLDLEALAPVVKGELPLAVFVNRASDILAALHFADEYKLKLIVLGAADGWMVAPQLAAAKVPVVVDPMTNIPDFESLGATLENSGRMAKAGVNVVFASFDAHNSRDLRHAAGEAVAYGMPWDAALRALTAGPAKVWGISDRYGTLEAGKDGDVVVWSGDPFELLTSAEHVFIKGAEVPADTRQRELLQRYRHVGEAMPPAYRP
ncbi:MAG TPA: amidohydrolase family protein [Thermoanaerobaculia bacterium]|nr:amidohydrolase family protein [Thermoanaerobaculia bacterium]